MILRLLELLLGVAAIVGLGKLIIFLIDHVQERTHARLRRDAHMRISLGDALESRDHRRLDDWLVAWAPYIDKKTRKEVEARRAELYVDDHGKGGN